MQPTIHLLVDTSGSMSFNPSVEGKPMQHTHMLEASNVRGMFQSLCRGEAYATFYSCCREIRNRHVSIPLSRGSLCNRAVVEALITNGYKRLFF